MFRKFLNKKIKKGAILMDEKSKTRYKDVDISRALTLKFISQRAYDLVRDIWQQN